MNVARYTSRMTACCAFDFCDGWPDCCECGHWSSTRARAMNESELIKRALAELKEIISDLEAGLEPSSVVLWEKIRGEIAYQIAREAK